MKKFGFTLAELLITLGIVGVVSALVGPALVNIMPDKNKAMFLKNYKELSIINQKLLEDNTIYYATFSLDNEGFKKVANCLGLECESTPLRSPYNAKDTSNNYIYTGENKYPYLLANHLGIDSPNSTTFKTADQTEWSVERVVETDENNVTKIYYNVFLTVDGVGDADLYGNTLKPKKFKLIVDRYGQITPGDALSEAYLLNKTKLNNKKADLEKAATLLPEYTAE